jgi:hypothetical protein
MCWVAPATHQGAAREERGGAQSELERVGPQKSVTIEAIDQQGKKLGTGRLGTGTRDYKAMLR